MCLIFVIYFLILLLFDFFNLIDIKATAIGFYGLLFGYLYDKYKPMEFKELVKLIRDKLTKKE